MPFGSSINSAGCISINVKKCLALRGAPFPQDPMQEPTGHLLLFVAFVSEGQPQTRAFAFVAIRVNVLNKGAVVAVVAVETTQQYTQ